MLRAKSLPQVALLVAAFAAAGCDGDDGGDGDDGPIEPDGPRCGEGTVAEDGACIPALACGAGTRLDPDSGACVPDDGVCAPGSVLVDDHCQPIEPEAIEPDEVEAAEPNDQNGAAGIVEVPAIGADPIIAYGCVEPSDVDGNGDLELDLDSWRIRASGPTLLDLEGLGTGGLAPAFFLLPLDPILRRDAWLRQAMDVGDGHSRWQVFLPVAGEYLLTITDARSLVAGLPAGGAEACYYAAFRQAALPEAVPVPQPVDLFPLESGVRVYSVGPMAGSTVEVIGETPRISTLLGLTLLIADQYIVSVHENSGSPAEVVVVDDGSGAEVRVVADANIDFGYAPVEARVLAREVQP